MIDPLLQSGQMPALARLIKGGLRGNLATLAPVLSPMLWTSIATGKRADKHGICGFTEPLPDAVGIGPVRSTSRKCKAIWNILSQSGLKSNIVGWYATHPAGGGRWGVLSSARAPAICKPPAGGLYLAVSRLS